MSLKIENVAITEAALAAAGILEDIYAGVSHKIAPDNAKARITLAAWLRDKKAELLKVMTPLNSIDPAIGAQMVKDAALVIKAERANLARVARERREAQQAEREAMLALIGEGAVIAA